MAEDMIRRIERTGDLRMVCGLQSPQVLGPTLQELWICKADGRTEWRNVALLWMSVEDYHKATDSAIVTGN